MKNKIFAICGMLGPAIYVFAVVLGGFLWPQYSHIAQPVSDLLANGSPNKTLLDLIMVVYNLLTIAFGFGLLQFVRGGGLNRHEMIGRIGAWVLMAEGVFGIFDIIFAEDAAGPITAAISSTGILHIVFAGLCSISTILAILLNGIWFKNSSGLRGFGWYSFISVSIVFVTGGMTAYHVSNQTGFGGLFERLTMGTWLLWLFVVALTLYSFKSTKAQ